jgi:hypothetical protein
MSMWNDYFKETLNLEVLEDEKGFTAYEVGDNSIHFHHVYVKPEFRRTELALDRLKEYYKIAKSHNKDILTMTVDLNSNLANDNLSRYLRGGAVVYDTKFPYIYLLLRLEDIRI